jgi:hypothetical protein
VTEKNALCQLHYFRNIVRNASTVLIRASTIVGARESREKKIIRADFAPTHAVDSSEMLADTIARG